MGFHNYLKICAMTSFGFSVSMCLVPIVFPLLAIFFLISHCVAVLIKLRHGKRAFKANGTDVLSGKETVESYPIINVAFGFRGRLDIDNFRKRILEVVANTFDKDGNKRYGRLMQIYEKCYGYYIWKDHTRFNIDQHVKILKLGDAFPKQRTDRNDGGDEWGSLMTRVLNEYGSERIQAGIPQWELLLLEEDEQRYTALFRFHHSIADGIYVSRMLCEEFLDSPTKLFHSYVPPSTFAKIAMHMWSFCLLPFGLWKILRNNDKNVWHGSKLGGEKRYFVSKSVSMKILREIRTKSDSSIHAILFSCLSYSLASLFKRRNAETKEITTLIPMPLQNLNKPIELKNRYAVVSLKLPTCPPDPNDGEENVQLSLHNTSNLNSLTSLNRLKRVKQILDEAKGDPTFLSVHSLITVFCSLLPANMAEALLSTNGCSVAFSNLPGPQEKIKFGEDRIEEVMFWIPDRAPLGVAMSILSYENNLRAGLSIDKSLLKCEAEGDAFIHDFENELDNILLALQAEEETGSHSFTEEQKFLPCIP